jgi:hypothetical protein
MRVISALLKAAVLTAVLMFFALLARETLPSFHFEALSIEGIGIPTLLFLGIFLMSLGE